MSKPFDLQTTIILIIGCGILAAMFMLIGVVLCLYSKVTNALKSCGTSKEADALSCTHSCNVTPDKVIQAKPLLAESSRALQCCDACSVYADVGGLPPCFCDQSEGL
ncbi:protein FAM24A-like [Nannospalax galili]|uniref:Protein FAM24A-like n=1 Tax=Nannospalax galili TaxID=1026970 RepID=A0A8C6QGD5_NANGA|nr:protein FAM24A-like [Nannospalax galili]